MTSPASAARTATLYAWVFVSTLLVFALFVNHDVVVDEGGGRFWVKTLATREDVLAASLIAASVSTGIAAVLVGAVGRLARRKLPG